jgi:hypothetical protein
VAASDAGVHRLVDMVVEEVSLVDRPANKQRFLIVKRDEEMAKAAGAKGKAAPPKGKGPKDKPPAGAEDPKDPMDEEEETEEPTPSNDKPPPDKPPPGKGKKPAKKAEEDGSLLSAALSALEGLTEAVEILATVGEDEAGPQLGELAEELDELADRLATAAGAPDPDTGEEGEDPGGFAPGTEDGSVGKALAAVRETIKRVRAVVAAAERTSKTEGTTPPGDGGGSGAAPAAVAKGEAAELREEVKKLRELLGGQQERIVALEKGVGLPNSTSADERPGAGHGDEEDESWPMDMNKPRDRTSVDKATSFHDDQE